MANCNTCGEKIEWGYEDGRWIPLEPIETHDDLPRTFQDENGVLRAEHRARHDSASVNVTRLKKKVQPLEAQAYEAALKREKHNARRRERRREASVPDDEMYG